LARLGEITIEPGAIPTFKNELIRLPFQDGFVERISISRNDDPNENLLRICVVYLRRRGCGRTSRFAIAAGGIRISGCNDHAVGCRIVRAKSGC
jgi:hypothetical protein